jgi:hypothetical protein
MKALSNFCMSDCAGRQKTAVKIVLHCNQNVSVRPMITIRKVTVMFTVSPASLQTFIDTPNCVLEDRVQYSTVRITNVFCDGHLRYHGKWLKLFKIFLRVFCTVIIRCTETFWSLCINKPKHHRWLAMLYLPDCRLAVGTRKVLLWPATSAQGFLGFPVSKSDCWDGSQHCKLLLHASHVALRT